MFLSVLDLPIVGIPAIELTTANIRSSEDHRQADLVAEGETIGATMHHALQSYSL
jgi:hypothetical protein